MDGFQLLKKGEKSAIFVPDFGDIVTRAESVFLGKIRVHDRFCRSNLNRGMHIVRRAMSPNEAIVHCFQYVLDRFVYGEGTGPSACYSEVQTRYSPSGVMRRSYCQDSMIVVSNGGARQRSRVTETSHGTMPYHVPKITENDVRVLDVCPAATFSDC